MPDTNIPVGNQQPVSISPTKALKTRVTNGGPSLLYYKNEATVSSSSFTGTIAAGASETFLSPQWLISTVAGTRVFLEHIPEENTDMATQAELEELETSIGHGSSTWMTLFYAHFATLNSYEFAEEQALPERIAIKDEEALGPVASFEVKEGDKEVAGGHRSELRDGNSYLEGDEILLSTSLRRESGDWTHFHIPFQFHDQTDASPPLCGMFEELEGRRYFWLGPGNKFAKPTETFCRLDITGEEEAWLNLACRVKISATEGELEVWRDDERQEVVGGGFIKGGLNTLGNLLTYTKCGLYRSQSATGTSKNSFRHFGVMKKLVVA